MKAIQVMFDEDLLRRLSESDEVKAGGRSKVVRRAVDIYLCRREREAIARQYRAAYSDAEPLREELDGWSEEGAWPDE